MLDSNLLGNDADVESGLRCLQAGNAVHEELTLVLGLVFLLPGPSGDITSDLVTETATPFYHVVASCAVGKVVHGDFKVMGVEGLRVVDASVQPEMPPYAGPAATVYTVSELGWAPLSPSLPRLLLRWPPCVRGYIVHLPCVICKPLGCVMRDACVAYRLWRDGVGFDLLTGACAILLLRCSGNPVLASEACGSPTARGYCAWALCVVWS